MLARGRTDIGPMCHPMSGRYRTALQEWRRADVIVGPLPDVVCDVGPTSGRYQMLAGAFEWGTEQDEAFVDLKSALTSAPILGLPNRKDVFVLDTDASDYAIGAKRSQVQDGVESGDIIRFFFLDQGAAEVLYNA